MQTIKRLPGLIIAMGLFLCAYVSAQAAPVCGDRAKVIASLSAKYHEAPVAVGVAANGGVIEVLKSHGGESWTILFTYPGGPSCLVASGEAWQDLAPKLSGPAA